MKASHLAQGFGNVGRGAQFALIFLGFGFPKHEVALPNGALGICEGVSIGGHEGGSHDF